MQKPKLSMKRRVGYSEEQMSVTRSRLEEMTIDDNNKQGKLNG